MATVKRFEELEVYKLGIEIVKEVWAITKELPRAEWAVADQMKRAAISVNANIAEGYERGSRSELIQFCYIAKGSAGELRSQLDGIHAVGLIKQESYERARDLCLRESGKLARFIEHLKRSKKTISGDKYRNNSDSLT